VVVLEYNRAPYVLQTTISTFVVPDKRSATRNPEGFLMDPESSAGCHSRITGGVSEA